MDFLYEGFGLGQRIHDHSNNWLPLNPDVYLINKPIVLIVGGSGTEGERGANGNAKIIQSMLDSTGTTNVDLLSMYYNGKAPTHEMLASYARRFTRDLFTPLLCRGNEKLPTLEACKNLRNVTIFAHSMGGETVQNMISEMQYIMKKFNYTDEDIIKIIKQIFVISYGATMVTPDFNYLNIISPSDEKFAESGEMQWRLLIMKLMRSDTIKSKSLSPEDVINMPEKDKQALLSMKFILDSPRLIREFYNNNERCYVMQESENELRLVTSPLRNSHNDHAITQFARISDGSRNFNATKTGDYVSRCMSHALAYSVANSILNGKSDELIPFDIAQLRANLEEITRPLNEQPIKSFEK